MGEKEKPKPPKVDISAEIQDYRDSLPSPVTEKDLAAFFDVDARTLEQALGGETSPATARRIRAFILAARYDHWPDYAGRLAGAYFKLSALEEEDQRLALEALGAALELTDLIKEGSFDFPLVLNIRGLLLLDEGAFHEKRAKTLKEARQTREAMGHESKANTAYKDAENQFTRAHEGLERYRDTRPAGYTAKHLEEDLEKIKINEIGSLFNQYSDGTRISSEPLLKKLFESKHLESLQELSKRPTNKRAWGLHYNGLVTASVIGEHLRKTGDKRCTFAEPELVDLCKDFYSRLLKSGIEVDRKVPLEGCVHCIDEDPDLVFFLRIDPPAEPEGSNP